MYAFAFVVLLFLLASHPSHQYASWLLGGSSCHVELRDTSEVIMNAHIKPPPPLTENMRNNTAIRQDPESVFIQVFDLETKREVDIITTIAEDRHDDVRHIVYIKTDVTIERPTNIKYALKLIAPPHLQGLQYVMDAITVPPPPPGAVAQQQRQRMGGKFTPSPVVGCSGSRTYGRLGDEGHTFKVLVPPSSVAGKNPERGVDVVAGWARGKEAVTLTHSIVFLPLIAESDGTGQGVNVDVDMGVGEDAGVQNEL